MMYDGKNEQEDRNYRDLLLNRTKPLRLTGILGMIIQLLSYGLWLPIIGRLLRQSFTLVCNALAELRRRENFDAIYDLLIAVLNQNTFKNRQTYRWWYLMRFGVALLQERQIHWLIRDVALEDNLILIGSLGPRPLRGYNVAYSFVGYALWMFERGDVWGAINLIKIAEEADETWGYPEYLHGWFGLFTIGVDSVEYFSRAVHIDWSFLQRMKHDKTCREHPEILHEVQKRSIVLK